MHIIRSQENGYKTDVRCLWLINNAGVGLMIEGGQPIGFSALQYMAEDMDPGLSKKQQHPTDLKERNIVSLHVDLRQRGVVEIIAGALTRNIDCWMISILILITAFALWKMWY